METKNFDLTVEYDKFQEVSGYIVDGKRVPQDRDLEDFIQELVDGIVEDPLEIPDEDGR